jgi:hypothetical protein
MKNDQLINSLINFLIPIIFLYGLYFLSDLFITSGFFALIYSVVLIILGLMIYGANNDNKFSNFSHIEILCFSSSLISLIYVVVVLLIITNLFAI